MNQPDTSPPATPQGQPHAQQPADPPLRPWPYPGPATDWWRQDAPGALVHPEPVAESAPRPVEPGPVQPGSSLLSADDQGRSTAIRVPAERAPAKRLSAESAPADAAPPLTGAVRPEADEIHTPGNAEPSGAAELNENTELGSTEPDGTEPGTAEPDDTEPGAGRASLGWRRRSGLPVVVPAALPAALPRQRPIRVSPIRPRPPRRTPLTRQPWVALPAAIALALASAFFGWVSAEPFWLSVGHADNGVATVLRHDARHGCLATFTTNTSSYTVATVGLTGVPKRDCVAGATTAAQMVSARAARAYATTVDGLRLRWAVGFGLVVLCGLAVVWVTGAWRFPGWRAPVGVAVTLAAPAVLTLGMLVATF